MGLETKQQIDDAKRAKRRETAARHRLKSRARARAKFVEKLKIEGKWKEEVDPERWIPRRLRKRSGRKRRGRKDHHVGNTQGVGDLSARDAKEFDAAVLAKEKEESAAAFRSKNKKRNKRGRRKGRR